MLRQFPFDDRRRPRLFACLGHGYQRVRNRRLPARGARGGRKRRESCSRTWRCKRCADLTAYGQPSHSLGKARAVARIYRIAFRCAFQTKKITIKPIIATHYRQFRTPNAKVRSRLGRRNRSGDWRSSQSSKQATIPAMPQSSTGRNSAPKSFIVGVTIPATVVESFVCCILFLSRLGSSRTIFLPPPYIVLRSKKV
jgi:hypothetical protein